MDELVEQTEIIIAPSEKNKTDRSNGRSFKIISYAEAVDLSFFVLKQT